MENSREQLLRLAKEADRAGDTTQAKAFRMQAGMPETMPMSTMALGNVGLVMSRTITMAPDGTQSEGTFLTPRLAPDGDGHN